MPKYAIHDHAERHYMTFQIIGWVDIFTRQRFRDIVLPASPMAMGKLNCT